MPCNLDTTIIDNLVICFLAAPTLLAELRDLFGIDYGDFRLSRIEGRFHRHYFNITTLRAKKLGSLYFDRFASDGNERYIWLKVVNAALYDRNLIDEVRRIPDRLGQQYYGISSLDLARDFGYDVASRIRKMMRREDLAVTFIVVKKQKKPRRIMREGKLLKSEMVSRNGERFYVRDIPSLSRDGVMKTSVMLPSISRTAPTRSTGKWKSSPLSAVSGPFRSMSLTVLPGR